MLRSASVGLFKSHPFTAFAFGVGNISPVKILFTMESLLFAWLGGRDWLIASLQVGVGRSSSFTLSSYLIWLVRLPNFVPFLYPFFSALALIFSGGSHISIVVGVCNNTPCDDEDAVSSMGGSNGTSWNKHRLDFVSVTLKVVADALQGKGLDESVSSYSVALVE